MRIAIVGGGIIGCSAAFELGRQGFDVHVFEARSLGSGATQATAGVLAPFVEAPARGVLQDLTLRSLAMYDRFIADVRQDSRQDVEYRRCGTLEIARTEDEASTLSSVQGLARASGLTAEWVDARQLRVGGACVGGLLIAAQGYVRVEQLMVALRAAAVRHGVGFSEGEKIATLEEAGDHVVLRTSGGRRERCDVVVIAAGSWSDTLGLAPVGVRPVRGQLLRLKWTADPLPAVMWSDRCYAVPWQDGTVLVGATVEEVGFDQRVTADGVRMLLNAVCEFLPDATTASFLEARAGLRPASTDGLPIVRAAAQSPRIIYATGHYRNGILLAPLAAALLKELVNEKR